MAVSATSSAPASATTTPKKTKAVAPSRKAHVKPAPSYRGYGQHVYQESMRRIVPDSLQSIKRYISANNKVDPEKLALFIKKYLKSVVVSGALTQPKGKGATGSFKLPVKGKGKSKVAASAKKRESSAKPKGGEKKHKTAKEGENIAHGQEMPKKSPSKGKKVAKPPTKKLETTKPKKAIRRGVTRSWQRPRELSLRSPPSLVDCCAAALDRQPMPKCTKWNTDQVQDWLENTVRLPQYKDCFALNYVTGRHLINIGPNHLVGMNIRIWDHIVSIMTHIRLLYGVRRPRFALDLTKPCLYGTEYDWHTLYYRYVAWMSPDQAVPRSTYWRRAKMMNAREPPVCHWYNIKTGDETDEGKIVVARVRQMPKKARYYTPRFREGHFVPTVRKVYYLDSHPLSY